MKQLVCEDVWDYGIEYRAKVHKEHPHVDAAVLQMTQGSVYCCDNGVFIGPVRSVCKLVRIKRDWETGSYVYVDGACLALHQVL